MSILLFYDEEITTGPCVPLIFVNPAIVVLLSASAVTAPVGLFVPFTPPGIPGSAPSLSAATAVALTAESEGVCS